MKALNKKKVSIMAVVMTLMVMLTGCASIKDFIGVTKGSLVGQEFQIDVYDHYANKTMEIEGSKVTVGLKENEKSFFSSDEEEIKFPSSVLEIVVNGDEVLQVGNTVVFAEKGLDAVEDYELPTDVSVNEGGGFVPFDRFLNDIKNKIGKEKTVVISSQMGIPIGVYQGKSVKVTVPDDLPKMTRLNIEGESLYIHRANYIILDSKVLE